MLRSSQMKTQHAIKRAGSAKALSEVLGISMSAISQWGDEVPEQRVWQLKVIRPGWFKYDPKFPRSADNNPGQRSADKAGH